MTNQIRQHIVDDIIIERIRQLNLPGSEFDIKHTPNDWIAISAKYLAESATRRNQKVDIAYRENLIKAAAVIVAALEQLDKGKS